MWEETIPERRLIDVPVLPQPCRLRRAESCLQRQRQCVAMQDLHMMLIPGKSLFIGQRDERTLLSHSGNSFLSGYEEGQRKGTLGFFLQRAFSLVFCETKQATSVATCSSMVLSLYPTESLCQG